MNLMRTRSLVRCLGLAMVAAATVSCGDVVRSSRSPVMLFITSLRPSGGSVIANTFRSDVASTSSPCSVSNPCVVPDIARATLSVVPKDVTIAPTTNNQVTITRYHVSYRRSDGRNTPGVDVPFGFDGAVTLTIPSGGTPTNVDFEIVRVVAKLESPLVQLQQNPTAISAIADVTFFGQDQTGNDLSVTGSVLIDFGNFTDS